MELLMLRRTQDDSQRLLIEMYGNVDGGAARRKAREKNVKMKSHPWQTLNNVSA
jgi:hypothetical protein